MFNTCTEAVWNAVADHFLRRRWFGLEFSGMSFDRQTNHVPEVADPQPRSDAAQQRLDEDEQLVTLGCPGIQERQHRQRDRGQHPGQFGGAPHEVTLRQLTWQTQPKGGGHQAAQACGLVEESGENAIYGSRVATRRPAHSWAGRGYARERRDSPQPTTTDQNTRSMG